MADRSVRVRIEALTADFDRKLAESAVAAKGFSKSLQEADGNMSGLVQSAIALAPALVPLGAVAVPAVVGLTTQLGFAALAGGSVVLAMQGVGDALSAVDKYQLDPTAANFTKLQQAMDNLGPAAGEFVLFIDKLQPKLKGLRDVAAEGLFPGVEQGISHLMTLLPKVRGVVLNVTSAVGDLVNEAGANLADERWQSFFTYLETHAKPILTDMGRTAGNLAEAFVNVIMAFDPLTESFSTGLLRMSRSIADWSRGLADSAGFQDFVAYVQANGPRVLDALGALGDALLQIVEAAAPVGSVVLPILTDVLQLVAGIADSPAGPVIIGLAAAMGALGRSMALLKVAGGFGGSGGGAGFLQKNYVAPAKGMVTAFKEARTATDELRVAQERSAQVAAQARDSQFALIPDTQKREAVRKYTTALSEQDAASRKVADAEAARRDAIRGTAGAALKAGAVVAGLAVSQSGLAEKTGLSNTVSLALMGTIAGPYGAAIGGGIGLVMDLAASNDDLESAMSRVNAVAKQTPVDFQSQAAAIKDLRQQSSDYSQTLGRDDNMFTHPLRKFTDGWNSIKELFTHTGAEAARAADEATGSFGRIGDGAREMMSQLTGSGLHANNSELTKFATNIAPALAQAGISMRAAFSDPFVRQTAIAAVIAYNSALDSASGKSRAVGDALKDLQSQMIPTATAAQSLSDAIDSLFGTELTQSQAVDQWIQGLKDLHHTLSGTGDAIKGTSEAALKNREAIRSSVSQLQDRVKADAAAGVSGNKLVGTLLKGRAAILDQAQAAGKSRKDVAAYLNTLGLTPKNLKTIITTPGLLSAKQQVQALGKMYGLTPKQVQTLIRQIGMGDSQKQIGILAKQYHLTPKQVETLVKLLGADAARGQISAVQQSMDALHDKTVTITVNRTGDGLTGVSYGGTGRFATGGYITGPGSGTSDSIPAWVSNGEYVMKADAVAKYGVAMMHQINSMRFADGGLVSPVRVPVRVGSPAVSVGGANVSVTFPDLGRQIRAIVREETGADRRFATTTAGMRPE